MANNNKPLNSHQRTNLHHRDLSAGQSRGLIIKERGPRESSRRKGRDKVGGLRIIRIRVRIVGGVRTAGGIKKGMGRLMCRGKGKGKDKGKNKGKNKGKEKEIGRYKEIGRGKGRDSREGTCVQIGEIISRRGRISTQGTAPNAPADHTHSSPPQLETASGATQTTSRTTSPFHRQQDPDRSDLTHNLKPNEIIIFS
jgi:hypothetical protein